MTDTTNACVLPTRLVSRLLSPRARHEAILSLFCCYVTYRIVYRIVTTVSGYVSYGGKMYRCRPRIHTQQKVDLPCIAIKADASADPATFVAVQVYLPASATTVVLIVRLPLDKIFTRFGSTEPPSFLHEREGCGEPAALQCKTRGWCCTAEEFCGRS